MSTILKKEGTCPVCDGACVVPAPTYTRKLDIPDTRPCTNCGGQYMFGTPRGKVWLNTSGVPCTHHYVMVGEQPRYAVSTSVCKHCGDTWTSDSGD